MSITPFSPITDPHLCTRRLSLMSADMWKRGTSLWSRDVHMRVGSLLTPIYEAPSSSSLSIVSPFSRVRGGPSFLARPDTSSLLRLSYCRRFDQSRSLSSALQSESSPVGKDCLEFLLSSRDQHTECDVRRSFQTLGDRSRRDVPSHPRLLRSLQTTNPSSRTSLPPLLLCQG